MKKILVFLLVAVLVLTCACANDPVENTDEATATATAKATAGSNAMTKETPSGNAAKPTATPEATPEAPEEDDLSDNLIPEKDSTFEGITAYEETAWENVWQGSYKVVEGYTGQALEFTPQAGLTYCSAAYNIAPYITEAGEYEVSFRLKYTGNINAMPNKPARVLIRGGKGYSNSFIIEQPSKNAYLKTQYDVEGDLGEWQKITFFFTCEEEDIDKKAIWRVCLDNIDSNVKSFAIDNFCVKMA